MNNSDSYDSKLSQARGLASQLGMFAEENDIPKDLWDSLEATIYEFYKVQSSKMNKSDSYDSKLSQARGLASQLGMFAEENDIPKDLWDSLEATINDFYQVSLDR